MAWLIRDMTWHCQFVMALCVDVLRTSVNVDWTDAVPGVACRIVISLVDFSWLPACLLASSCLSLSLYLIVSLSICLSFFCLNPCRFLCAFLSSSCTFTASVCLLVFPLPSVLLPAVSLNPSLSLSVCLPVCLSLPVCIFTCLPVYLSTCLYLCQSVSLSICLSACVPVSLSVCSTACLFLCYAPDCLSLSLSACLSLWPPASLTAVCLSLCLPAHVCLPACLSVYLSACLCMRSIYRDIWSHFEPTLLTPHLALCSSFHCDLVKACSTVVCFPEAVYLYRPVSGRSVVSRLDRQNPFHTL